jgi:hypothetical protein
LFLNLMEYLRIFIPSKLRLNLDYSRVEAATDARRRRMNSTG